MEASLSSTPPPPPGIDFYWRPGCPFCSLLERDLRRRELPLRYHNIWEDAEAAATVRRIANGNETVPTVVIGSEGLVNPRGAEVERIWRRFELLGSADT